MKYGRLPRTYDPRVPHFNSLRPVDLAAPPPAIDYSVNLPPDLLMYANDQLGDCTCAAIYHGIQVWSTVGQGAIDSEPQNEAVALYSAACGYNPADPKTDQGGNEQDVLTYVMLNGAPVSGGVHRLTAFVELDINNEVDLKTAIYSCGLIYIGFNVPDYINSEGLVWELQPGNPTIEGGHAVVLVGYDDKYLKVISWGKVYQMSWAFFHEFADEAYAIADPDWFAATGLDPLGMKLGDLETEMAALRSAG